jgi:glyoxylase-like metal-dependent hydrolase (beta-lactamase superfamily II)
MQEITNQVYMETQFPGVTLGAISRKQGLVLIDAPFRPDDGKSWRSSLLNINGGIARLMINLDGHMDRTMGAKSLDCTVLCHNETAEAFQNRPASIKAQVNDAGAMWEAYNGLGSIRWASSQITFSNEVQVHWDNNPIILTSKPGIAQGSIWAAIPNDKILFLGDSVVVKQPPFLGYADLPLWIEHLEGLTTEFYQDYFLIGGRNGFLTQEDVLQQQKFLILTNEEIQNLGGQKVTTQTIEQLALKLLDAIPHIDHTFYDHYRQRLIWGINAYYQSHFLEK